MKIVIQNSADIPIYQQIYDQIKEDIVYKRLKSGELLPSIRQLSKDLKVSVITVTRAYNELEHDGFVFLVQGKGCFVEELDEEKYQRKIIKDIYLKSSEIIRLSNLIKLDIDEVCNIIKKLKEKESDDSDKHKIE